MKADTTIKDIRVQLTSVFTDCGKHNLYNSESEQYAGVCGWCGVMSPLTRPAYIAAFGESAVLEAEAGARADIAAWADDYEHSEWPAHQHEATQHKENGEALPGVGAYIWGQTSWMKNEGRGYLGEVAEGCEHALDYVLLRIDKVITVSAEDFNRPELADELAKAGDLPGGGYKEDREELQKVAPYDLVYTCVAAVTDGARTYYIDAEGYDYARYIILPRPWEDIFADERSAYIIAKCKKQAEEKAKEEKEHADKMTAYKKCCAKWAKLMRPVDGVCAEMRTVKYNSTEYKTLRRQAQSISRANILAMCRSAWPGVKFSLKLNNGWGSSWNLTYTDGPTEEKFFEAVDLDLFATYRDTFDGMTDYADIERTPDDFCIFARKYMGDHYQGGVKVERIMSDSTRAALAAQVAAAVPGLPAEDIVQQTQLTDEQRNAIYALTGNADRGRTWVCVDSIVRDMFEVADYSPAKKSPSPAATSTTPAETAEGLTAAPYSAKATVVRGYTDAQYHDLVAMGGRYNRRLAGGPGIIFSTAKSGAAVAEYIAAQTA